jgi:HAD superfamily hydrolase (TIGR01509 family)
MAIRGAIFDLDGTLVDSRLDFEAMRREMELPPGLPILEAIDRLPPEAAERCWRILTEHELAGAARATAYPGVADFLRRLTLADVHRAVFTRNSRPITLATLSNVKLAFEVIVCREDGPVKPDPAAILRICRGWNIQPAECVVFGDHRFDVEAARAAGAHAVLFTGSGEPSGLPSDDLADLVLASYVDAKGFWAWKRQIDLGHGDVSC